MTRHDTLVYATILLAPLATALGYMLSAADPTIVTVVEPAIECTPVTCVPEVEVVAPAVPEVVMPEVPEVVAPAVPEVVAPAEPEAATPEVSAPFASAGASMLVHEGQVVLSTEADIAWARGRLQFDSSEETDTVTVWKEAKRERLPAALRTIVDAGVTLYDVDGNACTAQISGLSVYAREHGLDFYSDYQSAPDRATIRARRADAFPQARLLLGAVDGECTGVWARRADLPAPALFAPVIPGDSEDAALREQVRRAIARFPEVLAMRAEYEADVARRTSDEPMRDWPTYVRDTLALSRFDEIGGPRRIVNVVVGDGGDDCSDEFSTQVALLFTLTGAKLAYTADGFIEPRTIVDLERDGEFVALTEDGRALAGDSFQFPLHGCGC